jgi:hypothetical protein
VASLKHRDAFITDGAATWCAAGSTLTGWLLAAPLPIREDDSGDGKRE